MAKRPSSDKAVKNAPEDKLSLKTQARDQRTLEANANVDETAGADNGRRAVCYNRACSDYRVERPASQACSCRKTTAAVK